MGDGDDHGLKKSATAKIPVIEDSNRSFPPVFRQRVGR